MPHIGNAVTVNFTCWDTVNNVGKTGDASNITLRGSRDGVLFTPYAPSITQIDATNMPGVYSASLTASENNGEFLTLGGKSSTSGCIIIPTSWTNELSGLLLTPMQASINAIPTTPLLSNDVRLLNLDAAVSSRSTLTAAQVWANEARTLTAALNSPGVTTLLSRIGSALAINSGKVTVGTNDDKTGYSLSSSQSFNITGNVSGSVGSVTGAVGSVAGNVGGNVAGSVNSVTNGVTVTTNNDKTGYALSSAGLAAIWDRLTSALTTVGSIGKLLVDNINATIASRSTYSGADTPGTTTLLSRITSALSFTGGNVHVHVKAKDNIDFGALEKASLNAATPAVTVSDKTNFSLATPPPTAAQIRTEIDSNSTQLAAIKGVADKLDDTLEDDDGTYRFTEVALAEAPTGGSAPTVSEIWSHETRTLSSFGTLVADIWSNAARTLTSISDSSGVTTLLSRIGAALSFTSGNVHVHVKAKDNIDFGALEKASLNAATPAVTVSDKLGFTLTGDYDAAKTAATQTSVNAIPTTPLLSTDARLDNLNATISSRLASASYTAPPSASDIRSEIDTNSSKLDVAVGTRLATVGYTAPNNTDIGNIKAVTDKLDDTLELDSGKNRFTEAALAEGPAADVSAVVDDLVDGFLDAQLTGHDIVGSVGAAIAASSASGDPWATELPGTYATGTAGNIIGTKTASAEEIREELDTRSSKFSILGRILKF